MSSKRHAYSPSTHSPLNHQHINRHYNDRGSPYSDASSNWLNVDPIAPRISAYSPHSVHAPSMQSSRPSSATSAAHYYSSQTNLYAPSPPPVIVDRNASNAYQDQSSRASSATSAAHYYSNQTNLYAPSPPPVSVGLYASNAYQDDARRTHDKVSDGRNRPERSRERIMHDFKASDTIPAMPPDYQRGSKLTDGNLKAHTRETDDAYKYPHYAASAATSTTIADATLEEYTRKSQSTYKYPRYAPSVATSASVYSQESAPRSYYESDPSALDNYPIPIIPLITTGAQAYTYPTVTSPWYNGRSSPTSAAQMSTPSTNCFRSDYQTSLTSQTSYNTSLPQSVRHNQSPDIHKVLPEVPSVPHHCFIPQNTKESKVVRYAMNDEVHTLDPEIITYLPVGPNAASAIDTGANNIGIRNRAVKRGQHKHSASASGSGATRPVMSSSASVKSLPMSSGRRDLALLKKKRNNKSSVDLGETQSLYSAKSTTTATAAKRFLGRLRFGRFLPKSKKNNLSALDLDGYEANHYFSKTHEEHKMGQ